MSNIQTGAERMPHYLSHLGFLAGQIGRLIPISTTPVIARDSFEMDAVGAFFFNATPTTQVYTLSLHDALPIYLVYERAREAFTFHPGPVFAQVLLADE